MQLTPEQLRKAQTAGSPEELMEMAKAEGIDVSPEEVADAYSRMHSSGELSDDELDSIAGGKGGNVIKKAVVCKCICDGVECGFRTGQKYDISGSMPKPFTDHERYLGFKVMKMHHPVFQWED